MSIHLVAALPGSNGGTDHRHSVERALGYSMQTALIPAVRFGAPKRWTWSHSASSVLGERQSFESETDSAPPLSTLDRALRLASNLQSERSSEPFADRIGGRLTSPIWNASPRRPSDIRWAPHALLHTSVLESVWCGRQALALD